MKTAERYLCSGCVQDMKQAQLIFKPLPGTNGERQKCEWCGRLCYGARYKILYGRGRG